MLRLPRPVNTVTNRRRIRYVDARLQARLLAGLVLMELALVAAAMLYVYLDLTAAIDANIYRVHHGAERSVFEVLAPRLGIALAALLALNILAVFTVQRLWRRYVEKLLTEFDTLLERTAALDFRAAGEEAGRPASHEVLARMHAWRAGEGSRLSGIVSAVRVLESPPDDEALADALERITKLSESPLPAGS